MSSNREKRRQFNILKKLESGKLSPREEFELLQSLDPPDTPPEAFGKQFVAGTVGSIEALGNIGRPESRRGTSVVERLDIGEPETLAGSAGRLAGEAALTAPFFGGAAATVPKAAATAAPKVVKIGRGLQNIVHQMGRTFAKSPVISTAAETALGATSGAGGFVAEQRFPESDAARFVGEIAGGLAPQAVVPATKGIVKLGIKTTEAIPIVRGVIKLGKKGAEFGKKSAKSFTLKGGRKRAIDRFDRTGAAQEKVLKSMSEELLEGFTPAQKSGDKGLLSLEKDVIDSSDLLTRQADEQIASMNQTIQDSLKEVVDGDPQVTADHFEALTQHLNDVYETRLVVAAQRVDERLEALGPRATREQANLIAEEEINKVVAAGVAQEKELFGAIDRSLGMKSTKAQAALNFHLEDLGDAELPDIPVVARRLLGEKSQGFIGDDTTVKQMRSLQSKLRERARISRSHKQLNKARIADDIADAVTEDFSTIVDPEAAGLIKNAVDFSRGFRDRTRKGTIGKMMGLDKQGTKAVPGLLTFEESIGLRGPKAKQAFDDILRAFDSPEAPDSSTITDAAEDYIRILFFKSRAVKDGTVDSKLARDFIKSNEDILDRMPHVRTQIEDAIRDKDTFSLLEAGKARAQTSMKKAKLTLFIQKTPEQAYDEVFLAKNSALEMQKLVKEAGNDTTGEALAGLKAGFIDFLSGRGVIKQTDVKDLPFVSGQHLNNFFKDPEIEKVTKILFNTKERKRLNVVVRSALKLDRARKAKPSKEGIIGDVPGKISSFLAGTVGAAFGTKTAERMGGGSIRIPNIMSRTFTKALNAGVADPARRFITDAMQDEKLFKDVLLAKVSDGKPVPKIITRRLNAWLASVIAEEGLTPPKEELPEEQEQPPQPLPDDLQRVLGRVQTQKDRLVPPNLEDIVLSHRGRPLSTVSAGSR